LGTYSWIIFTSANGVVFFWERLREKRRLHRVPRSLKVCAIGPATANQLEERGVSVHLVPKEFIAESIVEAFEKIGIKGKRILLARAKRARDVLPRGLKKLGAEVDVVEVYRTVKPRGVSKKLTALLLNRKVDVIAFTSSSTVNHFTELLKKSDLKKILRGVVIACIGPVTADTARSRGMKVLIQPREYTIPGLGQAIARYFRK
jgi:uroporphyrinogen III methyltransferase/synthase